MAKLYPSWWCISCRWYLWFLWSGSSGLRHVSWIWTSSIGFHLVLSPKAATGFSNGLCPRCLRFQFRPIGARCTYKLEGRNAILNFPLTELQRREVEAMDWGKLILSLRGTTYRNFVDSATVLACYGEINSKSKSFPSVSTVYARWALNSCSSTVREVLCSVCFNVQLQWLNNLQLDMTRYNLSIPAISSIYTCMQ